MKLLAFVALAAVLLVSACVRPGEIAKDESGLGSLSIGSSDGLGMGELPSGATGSDDQGLVGEEVDLGPIV